MSAAGIEVVLTSGSHNCKFSTHSTPVAYQPRPSRSSPPFLHGFVVAPHIHCEAAAPVRAFVLVAKTLVDFFCAHKFNFQLLASRSHTQMYFICVCVCAYAGDTHVHTQTERETGLLFIYIHIRICVRPCVWHLSISPRTPAGYTASATLPSASAASCRRPASATGCCCCSCCSCCMYFIRSSYLL